MKKNKFAYYPGCSLHGTAKEYDVSTRAVCKKLGIELVEVPDWNCCGASSAHSLDKELALLLPGRNLKIIEEQGLDVVIPCSACFSRTKTCLNFLEKETSLRSNIEKKLNYKFKRKIKVYNLVEFFVEILGLDEIKRNIKYSLKGINTVSYYGCLLVRPQEIAPIDDKENPQFLDQLISAVGVTSIDWPFKTECCGASLSLSKSGLVREIVGDMVNWAKESEIDAIITACPLCQANLEMRQTKEQNMPVFYFTEILGLALGLKEVTSSFKDHLIDNQKLLEKFIKENNIPADFFI